MTNDRRADWYAALVRFCEVIRKRFGEWPASIKLHCEDAKIIPRLPAPTPEKVEPPRKTEDNKG